MRLTLYYKKPPPINWRVSRAVCLVQLARHNRFVNALNRRSTMFNLGNQWIFLRPRKARKSRCTKAISSKTYEQKTVSINHETEFSDWKRWVVALLIFFVISAQTQIADLFARHHWVEMGFRSFQETDSKRKAESLRSHFDHRKERNWDAN